jgi:hypothetical protein
MGDNGRLETGDSDQPVLSCDTQVANADLHKYFRCTITLITLIAAINHRGHPTLKNPDAGDCRGAFVPPKTNPTDPVVPLDAVAAILVRGAEVVAVSANNNLFNPEGVASAQPIHNPAIESKLQLTISSDDNRLLMPVDDLELFGLEGDDPDFEAALISAQFAAISNPDIKDRYTFSSCPPACIITEAGTSRWQHVTKGWEAMLDAVPASA